MILYDYRCATCGTEQERFAPLIERRHQTCETCGQALELLVRPTARYDPRQQDSYYDEGLGVEITGRDHRRRVMRDLHCDHKEPPSKGDRSARRDKIADRRREEARR